MTAEAASFYQGFADRAGVPLPELFGRQMQIRSADLGPLKLSGQPGCMPKDYRTYAEAVGQIDAAHWGIVNCVSGFLAGAMIEGAAEASHGGRYGGNYPGIAESLMKPGTQPGTKDFIDEIRASVLGPSEIASSGVRRMLHSRHQGVSDDRSILFVVFGNAYRPMFNPDKPPKKLEPRVMAVVLSAGAPPEEPQPTRQATPIYYGTAPCNRRIATMQALTDMGLLELEDNPLVWSESLQSASPRPEDQQLPQPPSE